MRRLTNLSVSAAFQAALAECLGQELLAEKDAFVRSRRIRRALWLSALAMVVALLIFSIYH